jgi:mycothiol synthase
MNHYTIQPYRAEDLETIFTILRARPADRLSDYPSFADLREIFADPSARECAAVWMDRSGCAAGYVLLNLGQTYAGLVFESAVEDARLLDEMIAWGLAKCADGYQGEAREVTTGTNQDQTARIAALERAGFTLLAESVLSLTRDLSEPIPPPVVPPGFSIRGLRGSAEASAWVALHRAAFGTENMTLEAKQVLMSLAGYEPELDLVAVAPDGGLAAYVLCSIDRDCFALSGIKNGYTDPVATHPSFQQRGLAKALLLTGLGRLRARGMDFARLSTASDNIAMQAAAFAAGYRVVGRGIRYSRPFNNQGRTP